MDFDSIDLGSIPSSPAIYRGLARESNEVQIIISTENGLLGKPRANCTSSREYVVRVRDRC